MKTFRTFAGKFSKQSPQLDSLMYLENVLETPYRTLKKLLDRNAYSQIDLTKLFSVVGAWEVWNIAELKVFRDIPH